jgi:hypothetical protein
MKPSEIRETLLEQHTGLRALIEETSRAIEQWGRGDAARADALSCLARLSAAVRRHNACEEELLRDLIPKVDAWGPARAEIMSTQHVKEHHALSAALMDVSAADEGNMAATLIANLRERMLEHMAREENGFLAEDVLRDDVVVIDSFGG